MIDTCSWCGKEVTRETGVILRATDKIKILVCREHAQMAKDYVQATAMMAAESLRGGIRAYVKRKFPIARKIAAVAQFLAEPNGEPPS